MRHKLYSRDGRFKVELFHDRATLPFQVEYFESRVEADQFIKDWYNGAWKDITNE